MPTPRNILVVDDEPGMLRYMKTMLELDAYKVATANNGNSAVEQVGQGNHPDLVLLDLVMPGIDGLQTLKKLRLIEPELKVIMLSCVAETSKVVEAMRLGAHNYLTKPFQKPEFDTALKQCFDGSICADNDLGGNADELEEVGEDLFFVAASSCMRKIRSEAKMIANVDVPVLILGESGTGKEILARLIHKSSTRAKRTFLKINCAAVPNELLESELFGYESGAFTGATRTKPGKFEQCDKGTLLLDEIGEMSPALQSKLLHVLQDQEFSPLGSRRSVKVDVRILAATNINVQEALADKKLRQDLYYRLNAFTLTLPPLRERKEEIPILLKHFMFRMSQSYGRTPLPLSSQMLDRCQRYSWPGNLRELSNFVKRYLILGDEGWALNELAQGATNGNQHLSPEHRGSVEGSRDLKGLVRGLKDEAEAQAIAQTLQQTQWNRKQAAALLQISYKALLYKIRQYGLQSPASTPLHSRSMAAGQHS